MVLRYMFDADGIQSVPHREWLLDFKQAIDDVRSVLKEQCRGDEFIGAKVGEWTRYRTWDVVNKHVDDRSYTLLSVFFLQRKWSGTWMTALP